MFTILISNSFSLYSQYTVKFSLMISLLVYYTLFLQLLWFNNSLCYSRAGLINTVNYLSVLLPVLCPAGVFSYCVTYGTIHGQTYVHSARDL